MPTSSGRASRAAAVRGRPARIVDSDTGGILAAFLRRHPRVAVLTGAGVSTGSGIPDYRDDHGNWKHRRPVQYAEFLAEPDVRRRYWAQSFHGWRRIAGAKPNGAHAAIARLEKAGRVAGVITQNVDDLHRRAGSRVVIDLHGVLARVRCLQCGTLTSRAAFQGLLEDSNPGWRASVQALGPDGDSTLTTDDFRCFNVPGCRACGGILKPDVVFFGESVPVRRVDRARSLVSAADALLIIGSSLMVFSGFRFARLAHAAGLPIAIVNRGVTRADGIASFRLAGDCETILADSLAAAGG